MRLLGVRHAVAGGHQVELAGPDHLLGAEAVAVQHLAGDQPRDGLQADVRMRPDVDALVLGDAAGPMWSATAPSPSPGVRLRLHVPQGTTPEDIEAADGPLQGDTPPHFVLGMRGEFTVE